MKATRTVALPESLVERIDELKINKRETYGDIIERIVEFYERNNKKKEGK